MSEVGNMFKIENTSLVSNIVRSSEWWDYKITSILGTVYATAYLFQIPLAALFPFFFFLLAALIPGASYVSLLNDLTDLEEDKLAGKQNRLEEKPRYFALILIAVCIFAGVIAAFFLSGITLVLYCCAWIVFTLYSVPPFRLKKRGFLGVLADASGSHVFPQLFAISALTDWCHKEIDWVWFCAVGIWSFALGLRGILWHQLKDRDNDKIIGIKTFIRRHDESFVLKIVRRLIFPVEISAFIFMLADTRSVPAFVFLAFYFALDLIRRYLWKIDIFLVNSSPNHKIFMDEYYNVFFPLIFLLAGSDFSLLWFLLFILHLTLFFRRIYYLGFELYLIIRGGFFRLIKLLPGH